MHTHMLCMSSGPAAGPYVPAGWYHVDSCDDVHTACAITVFWQVKLKLVLCHAVLSPLLQEKNKKRGVYKIKIDC